MLIERYGPPQTNVPSLPEGINQTNVLSPPATRAIVPALVELPPVEGPTDATTTASGPDPAQSFEFRWRVVELGDLVASHNARGQANPLFPTELQPRDRRQARTNGGVNHKGLGGEAQSFVCCPARTAPGREGSVQAITSRYCAAMVSRANWSRSRA